MHELQRQIEVARQLGLFGAVGILIYWQLAAVAAKDRKPSRVV